MTPSDPTNMPRVQSDPFALVLPTHLEFEVQSPMLGPDFERGMIIEVADSRLEHSTMTLFIRRSRRTVSVTAQRFMLSWCRGSLRCLDVRYRDPLLLPDFDAAFSALQAATQGSQQGAAPKVRSAWSAASFTGCGGSSDNSADQDSHFEDTAYEDRLDFRDYFEALRSEDD